MTDAVYIDRYRVLDAVGAGAMGAVVRARDERLGRDVAIKRVKNLHGLTAAIFEARFAAEARALAALSHPGVVAVYDSGVDADGPYLVMELLAGPSLKDELARHGPRPVPEVVALGIQLARALEAAHARGILHRDIKPGNVVRAADGTWKLIDFGVAHLPDSEVTLTGQFLGTPSYAAPEALTLGRFSAQSDVFGLAATLLEAATGAKPRADLTLADVIARSDEPLFDASAAAQLGALAPALTAGLAIAPDRRPDAAGFAALLAGTIATTAPAMLAMPVAAAAPAPARAAVTTPLPAVSAAVSLPAMTVPGGPMPRGAGRWIAGGVIAVFGLGLIGLGLRCDDRGPASGTSPRPTPAALPTSSGDGLRFDAPPDLDDKAARDWRKIAEKIADGELRPALDKVREFERKHGASDQSQRLRDWLEAQVPDGPPGLRGRGPRED